jgi:geranylgeranyl diphosphate synthase type II
MLIKAFENANAGQKDILKHWMSLSLFDKDEKIKNITGIYDQLNIKGLCEEKMDFYYKNAMECLNNVHVGKERKIELMLSAENLMKRTS